MGTLFFLVQFTRQPWWFVSRVSQECGLAVQNCVESDGSIALQATARCQALNMSHESKHDCVHKPRKKHSRRAFAWACATAVLMHRGMSMNQDTAIDFWLQLSPVGYCTRWFKSILTQRATVYQLPFSTSAYEWILSVVSVHNCSTKDTVVSFKWTWRKTLADWTSKVWSTEPTLCTPYHMECNKVKVLGRLSTYLHMCCLTHATNSATQQSEMAISNCTRK